MKQWYDKDTTKRSFKPAEIVIVLLLIHCHPLQAKYCWPYVIESRLNDLNYIVNTPTRRKKRQIYQVTTQARQNISNKIIFTFNMFYTQIVSLQH
jgi:hypothetical protein